MGTPMGKKKDPAKPKKKSKKTPYQKAKDKAWSAFSRFIRTRDCLKTTGDPEWGICYTCRTKHNFKNLQAGHYVQGRHNSILFSEDGVNAQCRQCNIFKGGNLKEYRKHLIEEYGEGFPDKLDEQNILRDKFTEEELAEITRIYTDKTEVLANI